MFEEKIVFFFVFSKKKRRRRKKYYHENEFLIFNELFKTIIVEAESVIVSKVKKKTMRFNCENFILA